MWRTILVYGAVLVVGAFALEWLEYKFLARSLDLPALVGVLAVAFAAMGVWLGVSLTRRRQPGEFERNDTGLKAMGITEREFAVLELLAAGQTNKEIAKSLHLSPNTVKTHLGNLFGKLGVARRTAAVQRARELRFIP